MRERNIAVPKFVYAIATLHAGCSQTISINKMLSLVSHAKCPARRRSGEAPKIIHIAVGTIENLCAKSHELALMMQILSRSKEACTFNSHLRKHSEEFR
jgi:hypothetical protein